MTKYFKTKVTIEILSEENAVGDGLTLDEINYEITQGHCSGKITTEEQTEVTSKEMAKLLQGQGSDPEFFQLDADGNELEL